MTERPVDPLVGSEVVVDVGPFAHGGHCVARHEGRVVFVRHALPGERVRVLVTQGRVGDSFLRGDAVEVVSASPDRVTPPCRWSGPDRCGGCDLQHVDLAAQRRLKAGVVREQLSRLARVEREVVVEEVPGAPTGLGWRTRVEYAVDPLGRPGLRAHRSHAVVPVDRCLLASPGVAARPVLAQSWPGQECVDVVAPSVGDAVVVPVPGEGEAVPDVEERVVTDRFEGAYAVSARGFWQVHPGAAATFVDAVLTMLDPRPGERVLDLYSGVGLFTAPLAAAVGASGQVVAVEADETAGRQAKANCAAYGPVVVLTARVDDAFGVPRPSRRGDTRQRGSRPRRLARSPLVPLRTDLVVLDPPRVGAGRAVVEAVAALRPRGIAYVACDPAALARDTASLLAAGYELADLRAFDAFPMTHHVECVAHFVPSSELLG